MCRSVYAPVIDDKKELERTAFSRHSLGAQRLMNALDTQPSGLSLVAHNLIPLLFSRHPFVVELQGGFNFYAAPRTDHIFVLMETWLKQDYEPRIAMGKIETVVDIGAHIGDFSVWACQRFRPAQVVAVEPTDDLYGLLERNVALNDCQKIVKTVHAAIFSRDTRVAIKKGASSAMNAAVESPIGTTNAVTLEKLADENSLKSIDLLKIDIEGGEQHVLTPANEGFFRDRVKYLFMEAHDLQGNRKEDAGNYLRSLGYEVLETPFRWFFGIHRLQAWNPRLVNQV